MQVEQGHILMHVFQCPVNPESTVAYKRGTVFHRCFEFFKTEHFKLTLQLVSILHTD